jgi:hypothetical protein
MRSGLSERKQTDEKSLWRCMGAQGQGSDLTGAHKEIACGKNRRALALATAGRNSRRLSEEIEKLSGNRNPFDPALAETEASKSQRSRAALTPGRKPRSRAQALRAEEKWSGSESWRRQNKSETSASSSEEKSMSEGRKSTCARQSPEKERERKGAQIWRHQIKMVKNLQYK